MRSASTFEDPEGDGWMTALRRAEEPRGLGSIGPFELLDEVERGGQGVVFRARQPGTNRVVALKRMLAGSLASAATRARFAREVEAAAALDHPGIVTVFGTESVDRTPVLAMEWVDGVPITEWARGPSEHGAGRDPAQRLEVFCAVCDAVEHAHARGVLHRDLKPSNILVDRSGRPRVLDFGLAKWLGGEERDATQSAEALGTPAYAAPEQLLPGSLGAGRVDVRADVYALGVVLYEVLTGASPYGSRDTSLSELLRTVERVDPAPPSSFDPRLGRELDAVCLRALEKLPEDRYPSVGALAADLRRHLAGEPVHAAPPGALARFTKLVRRNPLPSAFALVLLVTGGAFLVALGSKNDELADRNAELTELNGSLERAVEALREENRRYEDLLIFVPDSAIQRMTENPDYLRRYAGAHLSRLERLSQVTANPDYQRSKASLAEVLGVDGE